MVLLRLGNKNLSAQGLHHDYGETEVSERKKFLFGLLAVFIIAASVVTRATIGGVIEQYNIPLSEWTTSMYVIQSSMILFIAWSLLCCWQSRWEFISLAAKSSK